MERVKCFVLVKTDRQRRFLRRYSPNSKCCAEFSYHDAKFHIGDLSDSDTEESVQDADPRWPVKCDRCDYVFTESDPRQVFNHRLYRHDDGVCMLTEAPAGAMYRATWMEDCPALCGADGLCVVVKLPNGNDWHIDGRASNCDSPCANCGTAYKDHQGKSCKQYVDSKPHKCWVRHGLLPDITVDKNGVTCGAGGGSISSGNYHGFLRAGYLERC